MGRASPPAGFLVCKAETTGAGETEEFGLDIGGGGGCAHLYPFATGPVRHRRRLPRPNPRRTRQPSERLPFPSTPSSIHTLRSTFPRPKWSLMAFQFSKFKAESGRPKEREVAHCSEAAQSVARTEATSYTQVLSQATCIHAILDAIQEMCHSHSHVT